MMYFSDDMRDLLLLFQKYGVQFAVCGGFAVAHYGFVRMTMDFDLLVLPSPENAGKIMEALEEFGFGGTGLTADAFTRKSIAVTLGEQPNQIDLLTSMSSQSTRSIIDNADMVEIKNLQVPIVAYEDLIRAKKEAGRAKDLIDIKELELLN